MYVVDTWSGRHAAALRGALRLTNERFAATLGTSVRTIAKWNAQPRLIPVPEMQQALDTLLSRATAEQQERFAQLAGDSAVRRAAPDDGSAHGDEDASEDRQNAAAHLSRRTVLSGALAGLAVPTLALDDLRRIAAAVANAGRYLDAEAVSHLRGVLRQCATDDGALGPREVIPTVLGVLASVEGAARDARSVTRLDLLRVGAEAAEFAGFLYRDLGMPDVAEYWRDRAMEWARDGEDRKMEAYVLLRKSQAAWDRRDARRMLSLAGAVDGRCRELPFRVRAEAAQQQARALAMLAGRPGVVKSKLSTARELFAQDDESAGLGSEYREPVLQAQEALCFTELGNGAYAAELLASALASDTFSYRDYGYFASQLALAHAADGDYREAASVALEAVPIARNMNSVRTQQELRRLVDRLGSSSDEAVVELRHELAVGF